MKTRQDIEDIVQRVVRKLLPKMPSQDIRPAYQQNDMAGKSLLGNNTLDNYTGFNPTDNFMYIRVNMNPNTSESIVLDDGTVQITTQRAVTFTIYGEQSANIALCLASLLRTPASISCFEFCGLYLVDIDEQISELHEIINEEWYERHDFTIYLRESVTIPVPREIKAFSSSVAQEYDIKVIPEFKEYEDDVVE